MGWVKVVNQQHVKFEELTLSNQRGYGLQLWGSETTVDVSKCVVKECGSSGMSVIDGALLQQHNVNFWRIVVVGCTVKMQIQKQD
jgi:hypothetical protein